MMINNETLRILVTNISLCVLLSFLISCANDSKEQSESEKLSTEEATPDNATDIVQQEIAEFDSINYDGFLLGVWEYDIVIDANKDEPIMDMKGKQLHFKSDYRYEVRNGKKVEDSGKFKYNRMGGIVTLLSDKGVNSEWSTNYQGSGPMILIGTTTYGNNARQMRLFEVEN